MKKSQIERWGPGRHEDALRVILHARWQRSRGRHPSTFYKDIRNPRLALAAAQRDLENYEALTGEHVNAVITHMAELAQAARMAIGAMLNGVTIVATPSSTSTALIDEFRKDQERQSQEYLNSPEYKRFQRRNARRFVKLQAEADALMKELPTLDFGNLETLLGWMSRIEEPISYGVQVDRRLILRTFVEHGFEPHANCYEEFNEDDADNHARWIIGQALVSGVHVVSHFTKEWKKRFSPLHSTPRSIH